jgi:SAM-dependent methyltransferase
LLERAAAAVLPRLGRWFPEWVRGIARRAPPPPQVRLLSLLTGYWTSQAISVAAALGIPDLLRATPRTARDLAAHLELPAEPLSRLLRALAEASILSMDRDGRYALTRLGAPLAGEHPQSLRAIAVACGGAWYQAWGELRHAVATGESAFRAVHREEFFDYLAHRPGERRLFDEAMRGVSAMTDVPVALAYDFSRWRSIADIGGGVGSQLAAILRLNPGVEGAVVDLPDVVAGASSGIAIPVGLADRLRFIEGDFRTAVPPDFDLYLLKSVVHDWSDAVAVQILQTCRRAMRPDSRLLLVEHVLLPDAAPQFAPLLDLMMLVTTGGKERTVEQYRALLEKAQLRLSAEFPTFAQMTLLEAVPA